MNGQTVTFPYMTTNPAVDAKLLPYISLNPTRAQIDCAIEEFARTRALAMRLLGDYQPGERTYTKPWHKRKHGR